MKSFQVPTGYRSPLLSGIKARRKAADRMKKDVEPTVLDFGDLRIHLARHFGFCYGVENAIDIAFRTVEEAAGKRVYLLSEMIHNPQVNHDLQAAGVQFLQDTKGRQVIPFDTLTADDIVITPAFGTTLETEALLREKGIAIEQYDTTCPFVEKVWNRSAAIASEAYTIVIHGKPDHEETRATFSHAAANAPAVVIRDMAEAQTLAAFIRGARPAEEFFALFAGQHSIPFDPQKDLQRIGVVNQTTMLASDTQGIADYLRGVIAEKYNLAGEGIRSHFADTRDTLCYATNDNQTAVQALLETPAHLAMVVGGYNSSNTSHLVELCEARLPTYYISSAESLVDADTVRHFDFHRGVEVETKDYLPEVRPTDLLLTSGASCPDAVVEGVIRRMCSFYGVAPALDALSTEGSVLHI